MSTESQDTVFVTSLVPAYLIVHSTGFNWVHVLFTAFVVSG